MRSTEPIPESAHIAFIDGYARSDRYDFVIEEAATGRLIGAVYLTGLSGTPEIGKYIGDPAYLGRGIARQAMASLLHFVRERGAITEVDALTRPGNTRNIAVNDALGFVVIGTTPDGYLRMRRSL